MISLREAEEIHGLAQGDDPDHDRSLCWCCCSDCKELHDLVEPVKLRLVQIPFEAEIDGSDGLH